MDKAAPPLKTSRTISCAFQRRQDSSHEIYCKEDEQISAGLPPSRQSSWETSTTSEASVRAGFACPFFKANPRQTEPRSVCARNTWPNISRLKEHLYRRHSEPRYSCARCGAIFDRDSELQVHLRRDDMCDVTSKHSSSNTISAEKMNQLRKRKGPHRDHEEEKWYDMFDILFPHHGRPDSPYADSKDGLWGWDSHIMSDLKEFVANRAAISFAEDARLHLQCDRASEAGAFERVKEIISGCVGAAFDEYSLHRMSPRPRPPTTSSLSSRCYTSSAILSPEHRQNKIKIEVNEKNKAKIQQAREEKEEENDEEKADTLKAYSHLASHDVFNENPSRVAAFTVDSSSSLSSAQELALSDLTDSTRMTCFSDISSASSSMINDLSSASTYSLNVDNDMDNDMDNDICALDTPLAFISPECYPNQFCLGPQLETFRYSNNTMSPSSAATAEGERDQNSHLSLLGGGNRFLSAEPDLMWPLWDPIATP